MEDEIRKVVAQIEEVSKAIGGLYTHQEEGSASFDSFMEGKLQYLIKKEEDLRKEKLLLLEISKNESESKALIYSLQ